MPKQILLTLVCTLGLASMALAQETTTRNVLSINGNNQKVTSSRTLISGNGSYSLALWVKLNTTAMESNKQNGYILGQTGDAIGLFDLWYYYNTKQFCFRRRKGWGEFLPTTCDAPTDGGWHFLVAVYSKEDQYRRIYLDGELVAEDQDTNVVTLSALKFSLGYTEWVHHFRGSMAEVSVWSKALTASEVATLKAARPTVLDGCVAYWPLDDRSDLRQARDISANNYPLTLPSGTATTFSEVTDFPPFDAGSSVVTYPVSVGYPSDQVNVDITGAELVGTGYPEDSELALTASTSTGAEFLGWCGDIGNADPSQVSISVTVSQALTLAPVFALDWQYDAQTKTISDGYWVLNVTSATDGLTINSINSATYCNALLQPIIPTLDLRKPIQDGSGTTYQITQIANNVFASNPNLTKVYLPNSLKSLIGTWSNGTIQGPFNECANLERIEPFLPEGLEHIGANTFYNCPKLKGDLRFGFAPNANLFYNGHGHGWYFIGTAVDSVTFGPYLTRLGSSAFRGVTSITNVTILGSLTLLGQQAFDGCTNIKQFKLPIRPETVEASTFYNWNSYQAQFLIDHTDPGWATFMADPENFTPWSSLSDDVKAKYSQTFPDGPRPLGLALKTPANQWLVTTKTTGMLIFLK